MDIVALERTPTIEVDRRFDMAYRECWPAVFRFAAAWTNDLRAAEDIAQDAFANLWRAGDHVDWSRPVLPWLLVTTRRLATDRFRRMRRLLDPPAVVDLGEDGRVEWLDVRQAFARLSERERAALVAVAVIGLSAEEASVPLGMTAGAVRAAVSRARRKLESSR